MSVRETLAKVSRNERLANKVSRKKHVAQVVSQHHHNKTGSRDPFSALIKFRLSLLKIDMKTFAALTKPVPIGSKVRRHRERQRTTPSLVTRVLQGRRKIPLGRVVTWGKALRIITENRMGLWIELVMWANALRDVRRNLTDDNPSKQTLEALMMEGLTKRVVSFRFGDSLDKELRSCFESM